MRKETAVADGFVGFAPLSRRVATAGLLVCALLLGGCESIFGTAEEEAKQVERSVATIYNGAMDYLETGWYETAAKEFDEVERQHPYSKWATKAQLMSAYAFYLDEKYDEAVIALDRFIELHPGHRDTPYAYYLKALSYYEQISDVGRDQKMTRLAMNSMMELDKRYPNSNYARDARLKIDLTRDHLAGKHMDIGRYYQRRGNFVAAINRYRLVIGKFQTTTHVPEALHRLTESYLAIGVIDEAQMTAAVLGHNFPGSNWYRDSYDLLEERHLKPRRKTDSSASSSRPGAS
jgi:outer membrane protein assembly factor BamD